MFQPERGGLRSPGASDADQEEQMEENQGAAKHADARIHTVRMSTTLHWNDGSLPQAFRCNRRLRNHGAGNASFPSPSRIQRTQFGESSKKVKLRL